MNVNITIAVLVVSHLLVAGLFIYFLLLSRKKLDEKDKIISGLHRNVHPDERRMVESRLNPHLFKNVLNSIQSHAYQTYFALDKLAQVLDYILYDSRKAYVTPKEEIQFIKDLIEINKIKLSPLFELDVKSQIDDQDECFHEKIMAPLIGIDLIENAFKHADIQSPDAFIKVIIEFQDGTFQLTVANKISERPPLQKDRGGIGTETLDQRLKFLYSGHYILTRMKENDQYIAQLKIHLRDYKDQMRSA